MDESGPAARHCVRAGEPAGCFGKNALSLARIDMTDIHCTGADSGDQLKNSTGDHGMKQPRNREARETGTVLKTGTYVLIGIAALLLLHLATLHSYTLFHSIAEGFCITISVGMFMFAWNSRRLMDNNYVLFLGIASLFIGLLDGLHALAYKGMGVFDTPGANLATELWILTRYMHAVSFLAALMFVKRVFRPSGVFAAFTVATILSLLSIFHWDIFPDCYVEGTGLTAFQNRQRVCHQPHLHCIPWGGTGFQAVVRSWCSGSSPGDRA